MERDFLVLSPSHTGVGLGARQRQLANFQNLFSSGSRCADLPPHFHNDIPKKPNSFYVQESWKPQNGLSDKKSADTDQRTKRIPIERTKSSDKSTCRDFTFPIQQHTHHPVLRETPKLLNIR